MVIEPGTCPPGDFGCVLSGSLTIGVGIGAIQSLLAFPAVVALIVAIIVRVARRARNGWLCAVGAVRLAVMNFAMAMVIASAASAFDLVARGEVERVVIAIGFGPRVFERGRSFVELLCAPLASLHFWLVAWDAWRWQRRKIAEHEARQRAESETRTPS